MTVIAAVRENETSLLIGADTGVRHLGSDLRIMDTRKLQRHPTAPLAWGTSGNMTVGAQDFSKWMREYSWPPKDWTDFRIAAADQLAELNGQARQRVRKAGSEPTRDDVARVLFAGWLDTPLICVIHDEGQQDIAEREFWAIGSGADYAIIAYFALTVCGEQENPKAFSNSLLTASTYNANCDLPIHVWRVTPNGVVRVAVRGRAKASIMPHSVE